MFFDFDFNSSNLLRNTLPYKVGEEFAENDFIIESNETIRQISKIESVTKGDVDNITILGVKDVRRLLCWRVDGFF